MDPVLEAFKPTPRHGLVVPNLELHIQDLALLVNGEGIWNEDIIRDLFDRDTKRLSSSLPPPQSLLILLFGTGHLLTSLLSRVLFGRH